MKRKTLGGITKFHPPKTNISLFIGIHPFIGLQWFQTLFGFPTQVQQLIQVMKNTFAMSLLGIAASILPLFFAILLNEIKYRKFSLLFLHNLCICQCDWTMVSSSIFRYLYLQRIGL